jgi:hypothetical protein
MHYKIEVDDNILRAELFHRRTPEEMQEFIKALNAELQRSACDRTLIRVRHSRPIFKAEQYAGLTRLAEDGAIRIALVGDSEELRASHHYIELLTRQHSANVRGFNDEASALEWLKNGDARKSRSSPIGPLISSP